MKNQNKDNKKKRNVPYEIFMVIVGSFLILLSFVSVNLSVDISLEEDEEKIIDNACNAKDAYGNYKDDEIECIGNTCYLQHDNGVISADCNLRTFVNITSKDLSNIKEKFNNVKDMCNRVNEDGLYLDEFDNNCIDGICIIKDDKKEYRYECPNIVIENDEDKIDKATKESLKEMCVNYNKGEVIKDTDELNECIYGKCKITNEKDNTTYALDCTKNIYKVMDEDQAFDDTIINKYLNMSCKNEEITESRFKENIRCSNGICSFHYKQENYFKKCDK